MTPDQLRNPETGSMLGGGIRYFARTESDITVADPFTGEVKNRVLVPYPNFSAVLTTAGGLVFTGFGDGSFAAYDDVSNPFHLIRRKAVSFANLKTFVPDLPFDRDLFLRSHRFLFL